MKRAVSAPRRTSNYLTFALMEEEDPSGQHQYPISIHYIPVDCQPSKHLKLWSGILIRPFTCQLFPHTKEQAIETSHIEGQHQQDMTFPYRKRRYLCPPGDFSKRWRHRSMTSFKHSPLCKASPFSVRGSLRIGAFTGRHHMQDCA